MLELTFIRNSVGRTALEFVQKEAKEDPMYLTPSQLAELERHIEIDVLITEAQQARPLKHLKQAKTAVGTLAKAGIERLGEKSPAQGLALDKYLLQDILGYVLDDSEPSEPTQSSKQ